MTPTRLVRALALLGAALVTLDALAPDASAGIGGFFAGVSARGRIVQLCVLVAGFSLLIILKKFSPDPRAFAPKVNYALSDTRRGRASVESGQGVGLARTTPDSAALHPGLPLDHPCRVPKARPDLR